MPSVEALQELNVRLHPNLVKFLLLSEDEPRANRWRLRINQPSASPNRVCDQNDLGTMILATHEKASLFSGVAPYQVMLALRALVQGHTVFPICHPA